MDRQIGGRVIYILACAFGSGCHPHCEAANGVDASRWLVVVLGSIESIGSWRSGPRSISHVVECCRSPISALRRFMSPKSAHAAATTLGRQTRKNAVQQLCILCQTAIAGSYCTRSLPRARLRRRAPAHSFGAMFRRRNRSHRCNANAWHGMAWHSCGMAVRHPRSGPGDLGPYGTGCLRFGIAPVYFKSHGRNGMECYLDLYLLW